MVTVQDCDFIDRMHHLEVGDGCPFFVAAAQLVPDRWGRRRVVSGRGLTRQKAEYRCVMEAFERHSAVFSDLAPLIRATAAELGDEAVKLSQLLLISERQYEKVEDWNRSVDADHQLPKGISDAHPIMWTEGHPFATGHPRYIPAAYCYLGYPTALAEGFPSPDSNGLAAGDTLDGAIERGLLEVIERDAVSIWWYGRISRPEMELAHDKIPSWTEFVAWVEACDRQFWILDLTHDLGIPVAAAVSCNEEGREISFGFGAARTPEEAAFSAMGEMVQFELTRRMRKTPSQPGFLDWCKSAQFSEYQFLQPDNSLSKRRIRSGINWKSCLNALLEHGLAPSIVDCSKLSRSTHVVRVVVPGLRYLWPRFAPGRLYNVAVELGWRPNKLREAELNPVHILY